MGRMACLILCLALAPAARAGDKGCLAHLWDIFCPGRLKLPLCCPDDYCRKPEPCVPPPYCPHGCDDYCEKPKPCLPLEYKPCGCDDYHPKPPLYLPCDAPGKCYPTDGCAKEKCWWFKCPWWGPRLCGPPWCSHDH